MSKQVLDAIRAELIESGQATKLFLDYIDENTRITMSRLLDDRLADVQEKIRHLESVEDDGK